VLQAMKPQLSACAFFLLLKGEHAGAFTPKWLAMRLLFTLLVWKDARPSGSNDV
jgi:hypothetical protein